MGIPTIIAVNWGLSGRWGLDEFVGCVSSPTPENQPRDASFTRATAMKSARAGIVGYHFAAAPATCISPRKPTSRCTRIEGVQPDRARGCGLHGRSGGIYGHRPRACGGQARRRGASAAWRHINGTESVLADASARVRRRLSLSVCSGASVSSPDSITSRRAALRSPRQFQGRQFHSNRRETEMELGAKRG